MLLGSSPAGGLPLGAAPPLYIPNIGAIPVFPSLPIGFPIKISPTFFTVSATMKSLRELRYAQQPVPLWDIELMFPELLEQTQNQTVYTPFAGKTQFMQLVQTFLAMYGRTGVFALDCPWDNSRQNQTIAVGNGVTPTFTIGRTWGFGAQATAQPIGMINTITSARVNGVLIPSVNYRVDDRNKLTFAVAPDVGAPIVLSFTFYYLCQFVADEQDFEEFSKNRWTVPSLKLRAVNWP